MENLYITQFVDAQSMTYRLDFTLDGVDKSTSKSFEVSTLAAFEDPTSYIIQSLASSLLGSYGTKVSQNFLKQMVKVGYIQSSALDSIKVEEDDNLPISLLALNLPGITHLVDCPECKKWDNATLYNVIMHLNDSHRWTREQIATWLDDLHDSGKLDLAFKEPESLGN